ncbi:MAG: hypothetical protein ACOYMR_09470 [Ilumatobacteraceae bacterium]
MAMAARVEREERTELVRSRVHGGASERAMVKSTASVAHLAPARRPKLVVVAPQRRTARWVVVGAVVMCSLMLGAAAFQTQLARRQLTLDTLDRKIREAHEQYDVLRRERAELRSPGRLAEQAAALGMVPATQTQFVTLDPKLIAAVQRTGVAPSGHRVTSIEDEFAAYAAVKAQAGGVP